MTLKLASTFTATRDDREVVRVERSLDCPDDVESFKAAIRAATPPIQDYLTNDTVANQLFQGNAPGMEEVALAKFKEYEEQVYTQAAAVLDAKRRELGIVEEDQQSTQEEPPVTDVEPPVSGSSEG